MHQLVVGDKCYLLDCGEYQGRRKEAEDRNRNFPFPCKDVSAVMLSHAHIDHSGNLPLLVKNGFHGPIYASPATADLCRPMLEDSASLQEHDAAFMNKRNMRRKSLNVPGIASRRSHPAVVHDRRRRGHISALPPGGDAHAHPGRPGRSFINRSKRGTSSDPQPCFWNWNPAGKKVRLGFTGDLGRPGLPIIRDPEPLPPADYLIMESTYGNRVHEPIQSVAAEAGRDREPHLCTRRETDCAGFCRGANAADWC